MNLYFCHIWKKKKVFTEWNDKIVALEKMTWFHFCFMKTSFLFFVSDHLLVGQLCTNPKSNRSLLSCLKVTQCSMSEIGNAPLYNSCSLPIQVMTTGPLPAPSKCKSGLPWITGMYQGDENKVSSYGYGLWCGFKWGPHHATSHLWSRLESQHQSVPGCAEECGDPLVQSGSWWQTLGVAAGLGTSPQVQRDSGLASEGVLRLCILLSLALLFPRPEPAGLLHLVIRREHHQHDLQKHQSQPDHRHPHCFLTGWGYLTTPTPYYKWISHFLGDMVAIAWSFPAVICYIYVYIYIYIYIYILKKQSIKTLDKKELNFQQVIFFLQQLSVWWLFFFIKKNAWNWQL